MIKPQLDDTELVARFQAGDETAFSALFRRHQPAVTRLVNRMLGTTVRQHSSLSELEDLVQDVFVQVYRSLAQFRGSAKVSTWIYRIAVNVVLMHRRSARSRPMLYPTGDLEAPVAPELVPDDQLARKTNIEALYRLLGQLAEKKRTVYILHEIEGLAPSEIAQIVGAPVLTVRTRLFYARRELLTLLRDDPHLSTVLAELDAEACRAREHERRHQSHLEELSERTPPNVRAPADSYTTTVASPLATTDSTAIGGGAPDSSCEQTSESRSRPS